MASDQPVNRIHSVLARMAGELDRDGQRWALLGGLAVSALVEPRFTRDIDLAIGVAGDSEAESLVHRLQAKGYRIAMVLDQSAAKRLATVRVIPPDEPPEGVVVDLLFASSGLEIEICRDAIWIEVFEGLVVPVCPPEYLLALKLLARDDIRRPQDLVDIRSLLGHLDFDGQARARQLLELITARGFNRGRDLASDFDALVVPPA